ncbi:MAG: DNA repair protein RecO [Bacilli bacterium]|jgi:DNA repair protein RecO (recombination protein O)|nr:DNA repair protein RecO [Bacilli bacterium]
MIKKVEGVIVGEYNYSESSKILKVITKEYGLISMIAKGARRLKNNLRAVSDKLTYGHFHIYYKEDKLSNLISVDVINVFKNIRRDIKSISYATFITELVQQVVKDEYNQEIYQILINSLLKIEAGFDPLVITNILELKMLEYLGVKPVLDNCAVCGNKKDIVTLSSRKGGYLCLDCYDGEKKVSQKAIKLIRMFYYVDIAKITKLSISDKVKQEIDLFIDDYYDCYTGLYLKSKQFLKDLKLLPS